MSREAASYKGYREIMGTNWPIVDVLTREGPRRWRITWGLCNGTPTDCTNYTTRRDAVADLNAHRLSSEPPIGGISRTRWPLDA